MACLCCTLTTIARRTFCTRVCALPPRLPLSGPGRGTPATLTRVATTDQGMGMFEVPCPGGPVPRLLPPLHAMFPSAHTTPAPHRRLPLPHRPTTTNLPRCRRGQQAGGAAPSTTPGGHAHCLPPHHTPAPTAAYTFGWRYRARKPRMLRGLRAHSGCASSAALWAAADACMLAGPVARPALNAFLNTVLAACKGGVHSSLGGAEDAETWRRRRNDAGRLSISAERGGLRLFSLHRTTPYYHRQRTRTTAHHALHTHCTTPLLLYAHLLTHHLSSARTHPLPTHHGAHLPFHLLPLYFTVRARHCKRHCWARA